MDSLTKALALAKIGLFVFPVTVTKEGGKAPLTENGHLDATTDEKIISEWFGTKFPSAGVGVHTGRSGLAVLDLDKKNSVDGFESIENAWLEVPVTFSYPTANGGMHHLYKAPENSVLDGKAKYRKMPGVDRRAGSSWSWWHGSTVPTTREVFSDAPEWLLDETSAVTGASFDGGLDEWLGALTDGKPNTLVQRAIDRIPDDMSHSEMVEAQYNLIRYGADGAPGVKFALDKLLSAWLGRPEENHGTAVTDWHFKFDEALNSGIQKYGAMSDLLENLPAYSLDKLPSGFSTAALIGDTGDRHDYSLIMNTLIEMGADDDRIATTLWNAPKTRELATYWGLEFVYDRIGGARDKPEPVQENPVLEEKTSEEPGVNLLTDDERTLISTRPSFVDYYEATAAEKGFYNRDFTRSSAWTVLSTAYGLRGYVLETEDKSMGLNLWFLNIGESGTGKSHSIDFRDFVLRSIFEGDVEEGSSYELGGDSSAPGLHTALLERDGKPSLLAIDEAARFFAPIMKSEGYNGGLDMYLNNWYDGRVPPSNKMSLKGNSGKSATTSLTASMFGTPSQFFEILDLRKFETGFLHRFNWVMGPPRDRTPGVMKFSRPKGKLKYQETPQSAKDLAIDLLAGARLLGGEPVQIEISDESYDRLDLAVTTIEDRFLKNRYVETIWSNIQRLKQTMVKCSALVAMYRGSRVIEVYDVLKALESVEEWASNVLIVVDQLSAGEFQRDCEEIMTWIVAKGGSVTKRVLYNNFKNIIKRNVRELDERVNFLVESGRLIFKEDERRVARYITNGE